MAPVALRRKSSTCCEKVETHQSGILSTLATATFLWLSGRTHIDNDLHEQRCQCDLAGGVRGAVGCELKDLGEHPTRSFCQLS